MTNETDLRECSAQIELVKQLLGPETFDLDKILVELETKKRLLMIFKPRSYDAILSDLESGAIIHPGDWVKIEVPEPEEVDKTGMSIQEDGLLHQDPIDDELPQKEEEKETEEKAKLEKDLQDTKDKLAELEALKELEKEAETEIIEEVIIEEEGE